MKKQNPLVRQFLWRQLAITFSLLLVTLSAQAQNTIESVKGSVQGGTEVVRIDLSQALTAVPNGFLIQSPARISLDFPGVSNAMGRATVEVNQGNLKSINVLQSGDRSRVVLNLKQPVTYKMQLQGKSLLVSLESVAQAAPTPSVMPGFSENSNKNTLPLKDIDFRRGSENSGRVIVSLPNSQVGVDIRKQGSSLVVDFSQATLPEGLRRRMDVSDFATPVQAITTVQIGDRVRMVIEPTGQWEHTAYQSDEQFVVEVKPLKVDSSKLSQGPGYTGQKLSLNFQNIEVRSLLQVIADFTDFNVVTSDSVTGSVTLRLQDVPWDQALELIMQTKGLGVRKNGNVLWIAPKDEIIAKEKLEREAVAALQGLDPLQTQSFQMNYTKAEEVANHLRGVVVGAPGAAPVPGIAGAGNISRILSPRGSVIADKRTNQLFVTDIATKLEQIQALITKLDIAVRQVLIEARIVVATDTFGKSLGVRLGGGINPAGAVPLVSVNGSRVNSTIGSSYKDGAATINPNSFVNLPAATQGGFNPATFAVSIFNSGANRFLNLELSALEADGKGKVVSSPRVVTADQSKALIEQGTELPYQTATSSGATSLAFRKANLKLEVTPQITPEGNIILVLDVSKDSVGQSTAAGFAINTKHVQTQVLVENGGTVVIGGIFELDEAEDETKVPFFGDIPGIGNLFKTRTRRSTKQEMLVFITPKMIADRVGSR